MEVNAWDIKIKEDSETTLKILLEEFCNINEENKIYFWLDVKKTEYTIFEKLIYDITDLHFKRLGLDINDESYMIECWTHYRFCSKYFLHIDVDDAEYKNNKKVYLPFLTTLTYFTDIKNPTMIIDVTENDYSQNNYKNKDVFFSFPKMLRHIVFEGNKYFHGAVNYFDEKNINHERFILGTNFWKRPLAYVEKYNFNIYNKHTFRFKNLYYINKFYNIFEFEKKDKVKTIKANKNFLNNITTANNQNEFFIRGITMDKNTFSEEFSGLIKAEDLLENDIFKIVI